IAASRAFDLSPPVVTWAFLGVRAMTSPLRCCSFETKARRWHWHNDIGGNYPVDNQPLMVTGPVISHQHNPYGNRCSIYSGVSRVGSDSLCQMRAGLSQTRVDARDCPCQMRATLLDQTRLTRHAAIVDRRDRLSRPDVPVGEIRDPSDRNQNGRERGFSLPRRRDSGTLMESQTAIQISRGSTPASKACAAVREPRELKVRSVCRQAARASPNSSFMSVQ